MDEGRKTSARKRSTRLSCHQRPSKIIANRYKDLVIAAGVQRLLDARNNRKAQDPATGPAGIDEYEAFIAGRRGDVDTTRRMAAGTYNRKTLRLPQTVQPGLGHVL